MKVIKLAFGVFQGLLKLTLVENINVAGVQLQGLTVFFKTKHTACYGVDYVLTCAAGDVLYLAGQKRPP